MRRILTVLMLTRLTATHDVPVQFWLDLLKNYLAPVAGLITAVAWRIYSGLKDREKDEVTAIASRETELDSKRERIDSQMIDYIGVLTSRAAQAEQKLEQAEHTLVIEKEARAQVERLLREMAARIDPTVAQPIMNQGQMDHVNAVADAAHDEITTAVSEAHDLTVQTKEGIATLPTHIARKEK